MTIMAKRLNDTAGIVAIPHTFSANPNGGMAVTARMNLKWRDAYQGDDENDQTGKVKRPSGIVGREGLKSATMYMGKKIVESSVCLLKGRGYK